jgi:hypothetical protein
MGEEQPAAPPRQARGRLGSGWGALQEMTILRSTVSAVQRGRWTDARGGCACRARSRALRVVIGGEGKMSMRVCEMECGASGEAEKVAC